MFIELKHDFFSRNDTKNFNTVIDNCVITFTYSSDTLYIKVSGRKGYDKMISLAMEILSMVFVYFGGFPNIKGVTYNGEEKDTYILAGKYTSDNYFRKSVLCVSTLSEDTINQNKMDLYRDIKPIPLYSMQYLVSNNYKHIITNHRITLLLHAIDGLIDESVIDYCSREIKEKFSTTGKIGNYMPKVYYLCKNYFFNYHRKYNCEVLKLLRVNQYEFLKVITDTRNWYSHFLADNKKQYRLTDGAEMLVYFEIVFYALRLYLIREKFQKKLDDKAIREYYFVIHDWILDIKKITNPKYKSNTYKIIEGFAEMERTFKELAENKQE